MRNALVFGNVWHAWAAASGTHAGSGPATLVAEVSGGSRKNLSGVCPDTAALSSSGRCRPSISRCCCAVLMVPSANRPCVGTSGVPFRCPLSVSLPGPGQKRMLRGPCCRTVAGMLLGWPPRAR
jgi:hypothetical protein